MRLAPLALLPLLCAACIQQTFPDPGPDSGAGGGDPTGGWGTGPGGTGGNASYGCHADTDCGASVCARDGECLDASEVKTVHVAWTVAGTAASTDTCVGAPHLDLTFSDAQQEQFGFSPVPCAEGKFTVDKLPSWYTSVGLARTGDYGGGTSATFDATGTASLDLEY